MVKPLLGPFGQGIRATPESFAGLLRFSSQCWPRVFIWGLTAARTDGGVEDMFKNGYNEIE